MQFDSESYFNYDDDENKKDHFDNYIEKGRNGSLVQDK